MKRVVGSLLTLFLLLLAGGYWAASRSKPDRSLPKADKVVVWKSKREMNLIRQGKLLKTYRIALGNQPIGHKVREGDERTPEGLYSLDWRNSKSTCYKSLHISYPNEQDRNRAKSLGVSPGGSVMVHGLFNGWGWIGNLFHPWKDWTNGCVAVSNPEMDEIWQAVDNGTPIEIKP